MWQIQQVNKQATRPKWVNAPSGTSFNLFDTNEFGLGGSWLSVLIQCHPPNSHPYSVAGVLGSQPLPGHLMVWVSLERQKQDGRDEHQKHSFHGPDIITHEFHHDTSAV